VIQLLQTLSLVLCVHFMQAPVGEAMPPLAVEELTGPGDGSPSVAADPSAANRDDSIIEV